MPLANNTLVLVTDGRKTLFFRNEGDQNQIDLRTESVDEREDVSSKGELATDAPGTMHQSAGYGRSTYEETDFKQLEEERWAHSAAEEVNRRVLAGNFEALTIIAPPKTLGEIRKKLHKEAERRVVCEIPKEMTGRTIPDIEALIVGMTAPEAPAEVQIRPFFTIGHSTRTIPEFVDILRSGEIGLVVDVRTVPRSRTNPQYNQDELPDTLATWQIGYGRIEEQGGLRGRSKDIAPETNGWWINQSFHNYADYALSDAFIAGLDQLEKLAEDRRVAIMCAEAVWWRCHRRIIADYLLLRGRQVFHLMGIDKMDPASMTPAARSRDAHLVYPAEVQA